MRRTTTLAALLIDRNEKLPRFGKEQMPPCPAPTP